MHKSVSKSRHLVKVLFIKISQFFLIRQWVLLQLKLYKDKHELNAEELLSTENLLQKNQNRSTSSLNTFKFLFWWSSEKNCNFRKIRGLRSFFSIALTNLLPSLVEYVEIQFGFHTTSIYFLTHPENYKFNLIQILPKRKLQPFHFIGN